MTLSSAAISIGLLRIPNIHLSLLQWMLVLYPLFHPLHSDLAPLHSAPRCCLVLNLPPTPSHPSATAHPNPSAGSQQELESLALTSHPSSLSIPLLLPIFFLNVNIPLFINAVAFPQNGRSMTPPQRSIVRQPSQESPHILIWRA